MAKRFYPPFTFKQFTVEHNRSSMKLGVDGVLLACWTDLECVSSILDIGTGCGIISLVCAQREPKAIIHAIEIDSEAFEEASGNFNNSPWSDRMSIDYGNFTDYLLNEKKTFDLIISNPPFFIDSLNANDKGRTLARHNLHFDFSQFFQLSFQALNDNGKIAMVFPIDQKKYLVDHALKYDLYLNREAIVRPFPHKDPKRILLEFSKDQSELISTEEFSVELERTKYTNRYTELVKDFYLHFA